jgi:hypothetical protein
MRFSSGPRHAEEMQKNTKDLFIFPENTKNKQHKQEKNCTSE